MKLYIANCTKQHHSFVYRIPEQNRISTPVTLAPGEQKLIGADKLSQADIDVIISHHRQYGMIPESEVKNADHYVGLCYSVEKPVSLKGITLAFNHNDFVLNEIAKTNLANAAVASSVNQSTADPRLGKLDRLSVEVVEQAKPGQDGKIALGVEVPRDTVQPRHAGKEKRILTLHR